MTLKAPFPYFGGKSRCAATIWARFGDVRNYVEPFFGSGAVLFHRPQPFKGTETVNDANGMLANFWRATKKDPETVARYADWPVNENDLHARHAWLCGQRDSLQAKLEGDPLWYDAKIAGWWVWGMSCWIGGDWCTGRGGPWQVVDGEFVRASGGISRRRPHLHRSIGVNRQLPRIGNGGGGVNRTSVPDLSAYFAALADRLRRVRVCCGDWSRVCANTPTVQQGLTAVFLDPPYAHRVGRHKQCYATESADVSDDAREWALEHGDDPRTRICLAGYEGEHAMPKTWECVPWKAHGGMANVASKGRDGTGNYKRERLWFSPHCLRPTNGHDMQRLFFAESLD